MVNMRMVKSIKPSIAPETWICSIGISDAALMSAVVTTLCRQPRIINDTGINVANILQATDLFDFFIYFIFSHTSSLHSYFFDNNIKYNRLKTENNTFGKNVDFLARTSCEF